MLTREDSVKIGAPPAMRGRYVIRCTDKKFGPNAKGNPMITLNWEIVGVPNNTGGVDTEIERDGKKYQVAGLKTQPSWMTLVKGKALDAYIAFYEAANGKGSFESVNPENPDIVYCDGLLMDVVLYATENVQRAELTDEQIKEKKARNEPLLGEPLKDKNGKDITVPQISISQFLDKYEGEVPVKE